MTQTLALSYRPKMFSQMVGAEKLIEKIRGHLKSGRTPPAWMFVGATGSGKTTIARIMAVSFQCTHQKQFGNPCLDCRRKKRDFDIFELNAAQLGIEKLKESVEGAKFAPRPGNQKKVYILDEVQSMSLKSQNMFLKLLEDYPPSVVWIWCTTEPESILPTLRGRCVMYRMPTLGLEQVRELVRRGIERAGGDRNTDDLAEALLEAGVVSPRNVLTAVEKYLAAGCSAEEAARVETTELDTYALCRAVTSGSWKDVSKHLMKCEAQDAIPIRSSVAGYLRAMLVRDSNDGDKTQRVRDAIRIMVSPVDRLVELPGVCQLIYDVTELFKNHKRG